MKGWSFPFSLLANVFTFSSFWSVLAPFCCCYRTLVWWLENLLLGLVYSLLLKYNWHTVLPFQVYNILIQQFYIHYAVLITISVVTICHHSCYYNIIDYIPCVRLFISVTYNWKIIPLD